MILAQVMISGSWVPEFELHVALCTDSMEPAWDSVPLPLSLSLSAHSLLVLALSHSLSLSLKINKGIKKNFTEKYFIFDFSKILRDTVE